MEAAIAIATANVKLQKHTENVEIGEVEENAGEWIVKGTCPIMMEGDMWAEKFEVVIDRNGKVKSSDYFLGWLKKENGSWTTQSEPPTSDVSSVEKVPVKKATEASEEQTPEEMEFQATSQEEQTEPLSESALIGEQKTKPLAENMRCVEETVRKIQSLKVTRRNLDLELTKLNKTAIAQINSLENEVNTLKEKIGKIRLLIIRVQTTPDEELSMPYTE